MNDFGKRNVEFCCGPSYGQAMYVEDALSALAKAMTFKSQRLGEMAANDGFPRQFIMDVDLWVSLGKSLSSRQAEVFRDLVRRYRNAIINSGVLNAGEIDTVINTPMFRRPIYQSAVVKREARYLGDNLIGLKYKFNPKLSEYIRDNLAPVKITYARHNYFRHEEIHWNPIAQVTVVPISSLNIDRVINFIADQEFSPDLALAEYLADCKNSLLEPSSVAVVDGEIRLTVNDNSFLAAWAKNAIQGELR